jgi:hypothetical protein
MTSIKDATFAVLFCLEGAGDKQRRWRMQDSNGRWMTVIPLWSDANWIEFAVEYDDGTRHGFTVRLERGTPFLDAAKSWRAAFRDAFRRKGETGMKTHKKAIDLEPGERYLTPDGVVHEVKYIGRSPRGDHVMIYHVDGHQVRAPGDLEIEIV